MVISYSRQPDVPATRWFRAERLVPAFIGVILLVAAAAKVLDPAPFLVALSHVFTPLNMELSLGSFAAVAVVIVMVEALLASLCIVHPTTRVRLAAASLFVLFSIVLLARFSSADAPSCACLGRFLSPERSAVWFDVARNIAFALALLALGCRSTPSRSSNHTPASLNTRSDRPGFTLIEIVVVIGIVGIVIALVVAALGSARRASRQTESLAINRQIAATLSHYAGDYRDHFPAFENRGPDAGGPVTIAGRAIMTSVAGAHMKYWPAAVANHDPAALAGLRHPLVQDVPFDPATPTIEQTFFWLTPAVAITPEAFTLNPPRPIPLSMLRAHQWSGMSFPSQKGLVLDVVWKSEDLDFFLASFGDGSADAIPADPETPVARIPGPGPHVPVLSTLDGLRGRDR